MIDLSEIEGNFEFLGIIDKPKAGVTYKVRNRTTGEFESLRALPGASYSDPESLHRFLREINVHTRLSHPNIVAFHDVLEIEGRLVMTAEFVEGTTLAELCRHGRLTSAETIRIISGVLAGLEEAHGMGILHRGITAEHVTVTPHGEVKLGGFGLAKPVTDVALTQPGAVVGDARYMSPEQVMGTGPLDFRADLYSVGVLLFQGLTGRVPFDGANDFEIMVAQVDTQPTRPSAFNPGIAPELEHIVLTALSKQPAERFASAREFRRALAGLTGPVLVLPQPSPPPPAIPQTAEAEFQTKGPTHRPRARWLLGLLGVSMS
ncbi:MAG: serine/threonine protein kinase [Candidatus Solibacter sp.]|nr:serine/threonine protein kinase [Candidatus Solibacter sp.]